MFTILTHHLLLVARTETPQERFADTYYSAKEVAAHATRDDAWVIVDGGVFDITAYIDIHPGGDSILENVGGDASAGFHGDQHPQPKATDVLNEMFIGHLRESKKSK